MEDSVHCVASLVIYLHRPVPEDVLYIITPQQKHYKLCSTEVISRLCPICAKSRKTHLKGEIQSKSQSHRSVEISSRTLTHLASERRPFARGSAVYTRRSSPLHGSVQTFVQNASPDKKQFAYLYCALFLIKWNTV